MAHNYANANKVLDDPDLLNSLAVEACGGAHHDTDGKLTKSETITALEKLAKAMDIDPLPEEYVDAQYDACEAQGIRMTVDGIKDLIRGFLEAVKNAGC